MSDARQQLNEMKKFVQLIEEAEKDDECANCGELVNTDDGACSHCNAEWTVDDFPLEESKERPYVCHHNKKGEHECTADSSYGAAKKAAEHWGMDSTAGINATLTDVKQSTQFVGEESDMEDEAEMDFTCPYCDGEGYMGMDACLQCDGSGRTDSYGSLDEDAGHSIKDILSDDEITDLLTDLDREGDIVYDSSYFNKLYGHFLDTHADEIPVGSRTGRPDNVEEYVLDNLGRDYGAELEAMMDRQLGNRRNGMAEGDEFIDDFESKLADNNPCMYCDGEDDDCEVCHGKDEMFEVGAVKFDDYGATPVHEDEECICKGKGFLYGDHGTFDCPRCSNADERSLQDKVADAELSEGSKDDCDRCGGLGHHPSRGDEKCPECDGTGKCPKVEEEINLASIVESVLEEFPGQPKDYEMSDDEYDPYDEADQREMANDMNSDYEQDTIDPEIEDEELGLRFD